MTAWSLFGDGAVDLSTVRPEVHHAIGVIEGAALALGLTPIELLDEVGVRDTD